MEYEHRTRHGAESAEPEVHPDSPAGATAAAVPGRRHSPLKTAVRNLGIALDTAARVVLLGRDGVRY
ncbi:hypothetical protein ACFQ0M_27450 [Kitasatospora aburaviensis]